MLRNHPNAQLGYICFKAWNYKRHSRQALLDANSRFRREHSASVQGNEDNISLLFALVYSTSGPN